jgi:hypothetical protein
VLVDVTPEARVVLDRMLPEVQLTCTVVMAAIDEEELRGFLDTLARIRAAIAAAPEELPPPAPRRRPPNLEITLL